MFISVPQCIAESTHINAGQVLSVLHNTMMHAYNHTCIHGEFVLCCTYCTVKLARCFLTLANIVLQWEQCVKRYDAKQETYFRLHQEIQDLKIKVTGLQQV